MCGPRSSCRRRNRPALQKARAWAMLARKLAAYSPQFIASEHFVNLRVARRAG